MPVGLLAPSMCNGSKSPKTVKAAVRSVLLIASRLSAGLPPPVAGSSEVNSKLVGVERAARATLDAQVDPRIHVFGLNSPGLRTPSAVFKWQPRQNAWLLIGPRPSAAVWGVVKKVSPSRNSWRSSSVASGYIKARRSCSCSGKGPTTPNFSRGTRSTGRNAVPAGGTAMSKIPDPADPASCTRSVSNWGSLGASEPSSAETGSVKIFSAGGRSVA